MSGSGLLSGLIGTRAGPPGLIPARSTRSMSLLSQGHPDLLLFSSRDLTLFEAEANEETDLRIAISR